MSSTHKDARWVIAMAAVAELGWEWDRLTFREREALLADAQRLVDQLPAVVVVLIAKSAE